MRSIQYYRSIGLGTIFEKVLNNERLSFEDGMALFACRDVTAVGALALYKRTQIHGAKTYYVVNRQVNYSNICVNRCTFCAFRRNSAEDPGAFTLTKEEILSKIRASINGSFPLDELHIVGGCHPTLPLSWFEDLIRTIHSEVPSLPIKAFTPVEIAHFARLEGCTTQEVLKRLKAAGLVMMPGGGAEIFDETLRAKLCPQKADSATWLAVAKEAHTLGITTNCTMLFGHLETNAMRVDHLLRLRSLQDETHGFTCFIPLPFLQKNSRLSIPKDRQGPVNGLDHLQTIAVSRLLLDSIPHIKAYWIMLGVKLAQTALWYGADDLDGTIVEEHIGHMAGSSASQALTIEELETMIRASGFEPVRRNATFTALNQPTKEETPLFAVAHNPFAETARVSDIADKVLDGERIDRGEADTLYYQASLETLGDLANAVRLKKHPEPVVTYVGDRNINYSNICVSQCRFCAFYRPPNHPEGYVITREEMAQKIEETLRLGGTQILLQGGHNPDLPFSWYEDLLSWMRATWPTLHIHAFSPPEILYWSKRYGMSVKDVIERLRKAGLDSIPGGGAEILVTDVRQKVSPNKYTAEEWLSVMREAHKLGLRTTATMMFGHEEEPKHRLDHLFSVRELQDETGGFTAFIPWTFQPANTKIKRQTIPSPAYLRLLAMSRIILDNVDNIQASWVTMGAEIAQCALLYGANDFGSLMIEENVVKAAGVSNHLTREDIEACIRAAHFTPQQRTMYYEPVARQS